MIRHLIKLVWNRKRSNFLLITEIFVSFVVLFSVLSLLFYNLGNYRQPLGYDYQQVWAISCNQQEVPDSLFYPALQRAHQYIATLPQVEGVAFSSSNTPYSFTTMSWSLDYQDHSNQSEVISVDEHYQEVLGLTLAEGRWMSAAEVASKAQVIVINTALKTALFGDEPALGKIIEMGEDEPNWKVVGVVSHFKKAGEYADVDNVAFVNHLAQHHAADNFLLKVSPSADATFEADMLKNLGGILRGINLELSYLTDQRRNQHSLAKAPMLVAGLVSGFLLINVALGLFGVLWYSIRKRREEIGLRRALGASQGSISMHFLGEALVIGGFGILAGLFFAVQFPLLDVFGLAKGIYLQAIAAATTIVLLLVSLCAWYPSRQAAGVQPAMVLHEE